jgi:hypothetical protein
MVNNTTLSLPGDGGPEGVANGTFQANDRSVKSSASLRRPHVSFHRQQT